MDPTQTILSMARKKFVGEASTHEMCLALERFVMEQIAQMVDTRKVEPLDYDCYVTSKNNMVNFSIYPPLKPIDPKPTKKWYQF